MLLAIRSLVAAASGAPPGSGPILDGLDLELEEGSVHALLGPNGSGKSTFAHVVMGHPGYEIQSGSVSFAGVDLEGLATWQRARLGVFLAPQQSTPVPGVPLREAIAAAVSLRSPDKPHATSPEVMISAEAQRAGLDMALLSRALNVDLSGGEQKRSEVVQMSMLAPRLAILDEIDSGLDIDGIRAVTRRLRELVLENNMAVLVVTHRTRILEELNPRRVHIMVHGRIVDGGGMDLARSIEATGFSAYR